MSHSMQHCIINGINKSCHTSCKTCANNSLCGAENACTSCFPDNFKVSENSDDIIFKCTNSCNVLSWKYKDGYSICKQSAVLTEDKLTNYSVDTSSTTIKKEAETSYSGLEEININEFKKIEAIGDGGFSNVFQGTLRGNPAALKVAEKTGRKSIHKESKIYAKISHQYIVKALGVHLGIENILFLTLREYDLKKYFYVYGSKLNFPQLKQYCIQVADAMKYLHNKKILHFDLKIENILVKDDKGEAVEISDFGCAIDLDNDINPRCISTKTHMSYELLKKLLNSNFSAKPSEASDVWSFAVTSWQIFQKSGKFPLGYSLPKEIVTNYEQGKKLPTPAMTSNKFWKCIFYQCFDVDPGTRPTMDDLYDNLIYFKEDSTRILTI